MASTEPAVSSFSFHTASLTAPHGAPLANGQIPHTHQCETESGEHRFTCLSGTVNIARVATVRALGPIG